jgi:hypothetical protein
VKSAEHRILLWLSWLYYRLSRLRLHNKHSLTHPTVGHFCGAGSGLLAPSELDPYVCSVARGPPSELKSSSQREAALLHYAPLQIRGRPPLARQHTLRVVQATSASFNSAYRLATEHERRSFFSGLDAFGELGPVAVTQSKIPSNVHQVEANVRCGHQK